VTQPIDGPGGKAASRLFELDQSSAEIFGVKKQHGLVMGAEPRLAVAEDACTFSTQTVARSNDVVDLVAEVMHPAFGMAFEKTAYRGIGAERFEELDSGVRQLDKDHRYAMRRQRLGLRDAGREGAAIDLGGGREVRHHDGDVIESSDHCRSPPIKFHPVGGGAKGLGAQAL
jgi:hypothetical protein